MGRKRNQRDRDEFTRGYGYGSGDGYRNALRDAGNLGVAAATRRFEEPDSTPSGDFEADHISRMIKDGQFDWARVSVHARDSGAVHTPVLEELRESNPGPAERWAARMADLASSTLTQDEVRGRWGYAKGGVIPEPARMGCTVEPVFGPSAQSGAGSANAAGYARGGPVGWSDATIERLETELGNIRVEDAWLRQRILNLNVRIHDQAVLLTNARGSLVSVADDRDKAQAEVNRLTGEVHAAQSQVRRAQEANADLCARLRTVMDDWGSEPL